MANDRADFELWLKSKWDGDGRKIDYSAKRVFFHQSCGFTAAKKSGFKVNVKNPIDCLGWSEQTMVHARYACVVDQMIEFSPGF